MACEDVRNALLERPLSDLGDLTSHIDSCPRCTRLLEQLRATESDISDHLDAFSRSGDFEAAFASATAQADLHTLPKPTPTHRSWPMMLTLAAAAVLTAIAVSQAPSPPAPDAQILALEPRPEIQYGSPASEPSPDVAPTGEPSQLRTAPPLRQLPSPRPLSVKPPLEVDQDGTRPPLAVKPPLEVAPVPMPSSDGTAEPVAPALLAAGTGVTISAPVGVCGAIDLTAAEEDALTGTLGEERIACLAQLFAADPKVRARVSTILLADAWARNNKPGWEKLVERHLAEVSDDDPDLCYKFALYLSQKNPDRADDVIHWAERALENRSAWTGETYTSRVNSLYKVRAAASQSLWLAATKAQDHKRVDKYHNLTKVYAREWYEYAKSSGKDTKTALQLCKSADPNCEE